jgi:hypothetical protein
MEQNDLFETVVGFRTLDHAQDGAKPVPVPIR